MRCSADLWTERPLLVLLVLFWGSTYLFIKVAVIEMPPVTLIALLFLGETFTLPIAAGLCAAIVDVALIKCAPKKPAT